MDKDLLTEQEIHEQGLMAVIQWLEKNGNEVIFAQPGKHDLPNLLIKNGNILTYVLVGVAMYPNKGTVDEQDKVLLLQHTQENGALAAIASIGLANAYAVETGDKARIGVPERNARFLADFSGLQYIQFENEG